ncbi:Anti-sigma-K factor rskA [Cnuella takakiae]|uniref:Anti-sigma-K factor rskA n=1 Tax=Cnuella takakiae TaxID=1302690 RepID=A0A1M5GC66_9BACT|nr:anti-sigma factor [Cnuella takakiae]OLY92360.1 hypothetical protein BUE76_10980 [Cnuella takakiae]SHG01081.1 Anti-sigma-K factor rskA [Cnuella takakiae]
MDLSCIISSGDLELYVLGLLPQDEAAKIAQLALLFPEIQEELDRIGETLLVVGDTAHLAPSPGLKTGLMQQLQELKAAEDQVAAPIIPLQTGRNLPLEEPNEEDGMAPVVQMPSGRPATRTWLSAASFIGLLLATGGVIFLASQSSKQQQALASLEQTQSQLTRQNVELQRQLNNSKDMVAMLQSDQFRKISLKAVPGKPDALVQVLWNTQTKGVYVSNQSLPQPPAGRQYQLWAIVDGKPVDAGVLNGATGTVQFMKNFERAEAFAITLERAGGSPTPTMAQMFVMGTVG